MSVIAHWAEWLAARISAVEARRSDELPDVCRFHRDLAAEIVKHIDHQHQGAVDALRALVPHLTAGGVPINGPNARAMRQIVGNALAAIDGGQ